MQGQQLQRRRLLGTTVSKTAAFRLRCMNILNTPMDMTASWPPVLSPPPPPPPPPPAPLSSRSGPLGLRSAIGLPVCSDAIFEVGEMLIIIVVRSGATTNGAVVSLLLAVVPFLMPDVAAGRGLVRIGVSCRRVPLGPVMVAPGTRVLSEIF